MFEKGHPALKLSFSILSVGILVHFKIDLILPNFLKYFSLYTTKIHVRDCDEFAKLQNCKVMPNAVEFEPNVIVEKKLRTKTDKSFVRFCPGLDFNFYDRRGLAFKCQSE